MGVLDFICGKRKTVRAEPFDFLLQEAFGIAPTLRRLEERVRALEDKAPSTPFFPASTAEDFDLSDMEDKNA